MKSVKDYVEEDITMNVLFYIQKKFKRNPSILFVNLRLISTPKWLTLFSVKQFIKELTFPKI